MASLKLADIITDVPSLRGLFVTAMPDCLLFDSWVRPQEHWLAEDAASYFGDLVRANREGLKALQAWSADMQVTIESADVLLLLREVRDDFLVTFAFDKAAPLGMVRLHAKRVLDRLVDQLPQVTAEERPRAVRVLEFLEKYAPDPHAAIQRIALRTGLAIDLLRKPESLSAEQVSVVEASVRDLLGLEKLPV